MSQGEYTYLKRVKMRVEELKLGMFVGKLDKKWADSPFLFQGFPIESKKQLAQLHKECNYVYVDFKTQEEYDIFLLNATKEEQVKEEAPDVQLIDELPTAVKLFDEISKISKLIMRRAMQNSDIDLTDLGKTVASCIASLERYPDALLLAINAKNKIHYTSEHSARVSILSMAFGFEIGMSKDQISILGISAMLHDIGKGLIPHKILNKPGKLDKSEALVVKNHPKESFRILSKIENISDYIKEVALSHHEREDGRGYPRNIPKDRVSRFAKIVSIIDAYDAIISDRPYCEGRPASHALKILEEGSGTKFDPRLIKAFLNWVGIYPVGTLVELKTGEVAFVIRQNARKSLSPRIMIVTDENKKTGHQKVVDIAAMVIHSNGRPYKIGSAIKNGAFGINIRKYLDKENFDVPEWCRSQASVSDSPFAKYL